MYTGKTGESTKGEWGESEGAPANILNKDRSGILDSSITSNHNYNKIVKSDWLSTALISALIGQLNRTVPVMPK